MAPRRDQVEGFLEMLAAERGAAANTLIGYRRDLESIAADLAPARLDDEHADAIALSLHHLAATVFRPRPTPRARAASPGCQGG